MAGSVENKVVSLKLDNRQFEKEAEKSGTTAKRLQKKLEFKGGKKGVDDVTKSVEMTNSAFAKMASQVDNINSRLTGMGAVATGALMGIGSKLASMGADLITKHLIQPAKDGLAEYELQMNSIQTIMANTASKGTTMDQVNKALKELNDYSDRTIYNFAEMTKNIGTFTSAGVGLEKATTAIKGIANLAAVSGSNSQQAATAMYQLSQALATGTVKLMDWNSVVNAGMGGENFQNQLKQTARVHGIAVDNIIQKEGSFRDSLQKGWLTSDILIETLQQYAGDLDATALKQKGYTDEQIKQILELGKTAISAASDYKTLSQVLETIPEMVGSGWAQTMQYIIGDFEEAKQLWTAVGNWIGDRISETANARNEILKTWSEAGGRTELLRGLKNIFDTIWPIVDRVRTAFRDMFPPASGKKLADLTKKFADFTEKLKPSEATLRKVHSAAKRVAAVFKAVRDAIGKVAQIAWSFGKKFGEVILASVKAIGEFASGIYDWAKASGIIDAVTDSINGFVDSLTAFVDSIDLASVVDKIASGFKSVGGFIKDIVSGFDANAAQMSKVFVSALLPSNGVVKVLQGYDRLREELQNGAPNFKTIAALAQYGFERIGYYAQVAANNIKSFFFGFTDASAPVVNQINKIKEGVDHNATGLQWFGQSLMTGVKGLGMLAWNGELTAENLKILAENMSTAENSTTKFSTSAVDAGIKVRALFGNLWEYIKQAATAIHDAGLKMFDWLDGNSNGVVELNGLLDTLRSITVSGMLASLAVGFNRISKGLGGILESVSSVFEGLGDTISNFAKQIKPSKLKEIATALLILTSAMYILSKIDKDKLAASTGVVIVLMAALGGAVAGLNKLMSMIDFKQSAKTALMLMTMAGSMLFLAMAVNMLSKADPAKAWNAVGMLVAMMAGLAGMTALIRTTSVTIKGLGTSMLALGLGILAIAGAIAILGNLDTSTLVQGGVAIAAIAGAMMLFGYAMKGANIIGVASSLMAFAIAINMLIAPIITLGMIPLGKLVQGIIGMAAALTVLIIALKAMEKIKPQKIAVQLLAMTMITGAIALAFVAMANLPVDGLKTATIAFVAAITAITASIGALSIMKLNKSVIGTLAAMAAVIAALGYALRNFAEFDAGGVAKALITLGGAMLIMVIGVKALANPMSIVGAAALIGVAAAVAIISGPLKEFAALEWGQIGKALTMLAGSILIMGGLGAAAGAVAPLLLAGSVGLLAFGAALNVITAPLLAFAKLPDDQIRKSFAVLKFIALTLSRFLLDISGVSPLVAVTSLALLSISKAVQMISAPMMAFAKLNWNQVSVATSTLRKVLQILTDSVMDLQNAGVLSVFKANALEPMARGVKQLTLPLMAFAKMNLSETLNAVSMLKQVLTALVDGVIYMNNNVGLFASFKSDAVADVAEAVNTLTDAMDTLCSIDQATMAQVTSSLQSVITALSDSASQIEASVGVFTNLKTDAILDLANALNAAVGPIEKLSKLDPSQTAKSVKEFGTILTGLKDAVVDLNTNPDANMQTYFDPSKAASVETLAKAVSAAVDPLQKLVGMYQNLGDNSGIISQGVDTMGVMAKKLAEAANVLQDSGWFTNAGSGAEKVTALANSIKPLLNVIKPMADIDTSIITKFGDNLHTLATTLNSVSFVAVNVAPLQAAFEEVKKLTDEYNKLNASVTTLNSSLNGNSTAFNNNLSAIATSISTYENSIVTAFTDLTNAMQNFATNESTIAPTIGTHLTTAISNAIQAVSGQGQQMTNAASAIMDSFVSGVNSKAESAKAAMTNAVNSAITVMINTANGKLESVKTAGKALGKAMVDALKAPLDAAAKGGAGTPADSAGKMAKATVDAVKKPLTDKGSIAQIKSAATSIGRYIADGMANGILSNQNKAINAAAQMAAKAIQAAKNTTGVHSPSRVFHEIGMYTVVGFANGIMDTTPKVEAAAILLADKFTDKYNVTILQEMQETKEEVASSIADTETHEKPAAYDAGSSAGESFAQGYGEKAEQGISAAHQKFIDQENRLAEIMQMMGVARGKIKFDWLEDGMVTATVAGQTFAVDQLNPNKIMQLIHQKSGDKEWNQWFNLGQVMGDKVCNGFNGQMIYMNDDMSMIADQMMNIFSRLDQKNKSWLKYVTENGVTTLKGLERVQDEAGNVFYKIEHDGRRYLADLFNPDLLWAQDIGQNGGKDSGWYFYGRAAAEGWAQGWNSAEVNLAKSVKDQYQGPKGDVTAATDQALDQTEAKARATGEAIASNTDKILQAIQTTVTKMAETLTAILDKLNGKLKETVDLVDTANPVSTLTDAIGKGAERAKVTSGNVTYEAVAVVGQTIDDNKQKIRDSGTEMVDIFLKAISDKFVSERQKMYNDSYSSGSNIINGFVNAIDNGKSRAVNSAAAMAAAAVAAASATLDIHSPSRVFYGLGAYSVDGFVNGLSNIAPVENASAYLGNASVDALRRAISDVPDILNSEIDMQPTITPVLDTTELVREASKIPALIGSGAALRVGTVANGFGSQNGSGGNMSVDNSQGPTQVNFTQNNYSPKALSRIDIYRQTKNLVVPLRGMH